MTKQIRMHRVSVAALLSALAASSVPIGAQTAETPTANTPTPAVDPPPIADTPAEPATTEADPLPTVAKAKPIAKIQKPAAKAASMKVSSVPTMSANDEPEAKIATVEALPAPTAEALQGAAEAQTIPTATEPVPSDLNSDAVAFGGALALLIIGAGALGVSRRRKRVTTEDVAVEHHEMAVAPAIRREAELSPPVMNPPATERPAFACGVPAASVSALSPTERAHRGPTPDNPSASLKKRLKRAAFFEQRERDATAGHAVPVSRWAGLPERLVESAKTIATPRPRVLQPA